MCQLLLHKDLPRLCELLRNLASGSLLERNRNPVFKVHDLTFVPMEYTIQIKYIRRDKVQSFFSLTEKLFKSIKFWEEIKL